MAKALKPPPAERFVKPPPSKENGVGRKIVEGLHELTTALENGPSEYEYKIEHPRIGIRQPEDILKAESLVGWDLVALTQEPAGNIHSLVLRRKRT